MENPLLASPAGLTSLSDDLRAAARRVAQVGDRAAQVAALGGWQGGAEHAFATAARTAGAQCDALSRRLGMDAARVARLAEELSDELDYLDRLEVRAEEEMEEYARRLRGDVLEGARETYERIRRLLPVHRSPLWRDLASPLRGLL